MANEDRLFGCSIYGLKEDLNPAAATERVSGKSISLLYLSHPLTFSPGLYTCMFPLFSYHLVDLHAKPLVLRL
jgi:hypothetical protein